MPFPSATGWVPSQMLSGLPSAGGPPDGSRTWEEYWTRQEAAGNNVPTSLLHNGQYYDFPDGTTLPDIRIAHGDTASGYDAGIAPNSGVFASADPREIADFNDAQRDTSWRGIGRVAALVGGGAALGATPWGSAMPGATGGAAAGGAQTFPYVAGGPVTVSAIPGVTAGTAAAGGVGAAAAGGGGSAATNALTSGPKLLDWLPEITNGVNALLGSRAADQAADAEAEAYREAIAEQRRQYDTTRADWEPWMATGRDALNQLSDPATHFATSPDYDFRRGEGTRDIENSFAARGAGQSGNALRALTEFNSNLASGEFGNWFNRQSTRAGLGTTGTNVVTNAGTNTANNVSDFTSGIGASRASGVIGKYGSIAQGINDGVSNYLYRRRRAA